MFDCSDEVLRYHNDAVTLPQASRSQMREKRNANRDRLRSRLEKAKKPSPLEFKSQGSYSMKTMVQDTEKEYDIDDGVYFAKEDLIGPRGGDMAALDARRMVQDALSDGSFNHPPEILQNCVRVVYDAGYHVDIPVYRTTVSNTGRTMVHELASSDWKQSDARDVTAWFEKENDRQSPDKDNGRQLRRITRILKKFAKSRDTWRIQILSGFGITKLITECFRGSLSRDDAALYETMKSISERLHRSLAVNHPVTLGSTITDGSDDSRARFLRDRLDDALRWLEPVMNSKCTKDMAFASWDQVFNTDFFSKSLIKTSSESPTLLTSGMIRETSQSISVQSAVRKEGGGRYA